MTEWANQLFEIIPENVAWVVVGIFVFLVIATILAYVIPKLTQVDLTNVQLRIKSWWLMVVVFTIAVSFSKVVSVVFIAIMSFLALKEYFTIVPVRQADRRVLFFAYLSIPIQFYWIYIEWYGLFIIFIPVYVFLFIPMVMVLIGETEGFLRAAGTVHWGLMTMVFGLSHMSYLLALPPEKNPLGGNVGLLLYLVILTQSNDVFQFLAGKLFGKHKIIPRVSPNKTWEGFLGAFVVTVTASYFLGIFITPLTDLQAVSIGVIISILGYFGDVVISAVKRDVRTKDSGELLPGHGGILDRVDSLIYTAPIYFHFVYYFHY